MYDLYVFKPNSSNAERKRDISPTGDPSPAISHSRIFSHLAEMSDKSATEQESKEASDERFSADEYSRPINPAMSETNDSGSDGRREPFFILKSVEES